MTAASGRGTSYFQTSLRVIQLDCDGRSVLLPKVKWSKLRVNSFIAVSDTLILIRHERDQIILESYIPETS